ncbi:hypothetical protein [Pontibacter cellulosilyticus]|uniref:Uncharacterized protein n=1 Tax=Pontibacter cellulosilyticus TaxID=1720253 RepID=A0A923N1Y0_9BACT|nr:hypothetical protein [Pontibacter cellulosilyticus]MBC5991365.1 hypothetical protein [Pontibacter cellulosilyticus]
MRDNRRADRYEDRENRNRDTEARWLHEQDHGQNSDRGNYTIDTHFNRGYGRNEYSQYGDTSSFNDNADYRQTSSEGRFGPGGARYTGEDYSRNQNSNNPYGMSYIPSGRYNSGRHYDARADYSDQDYDDLRRNRAPQSSSRMPDERFGHDVRSGSDNENWSRGSVGDYESYRRYEMGNRSYDNDYSGGFAGRNYTPGATHYGEGSYYSELDRWQHESQPRGKRNRR